MIKTFKSKALRKLFEDGDRRSLPAEQISCIESRLATLDASSVADDMNIADYGLDRLVGDLKGCHAVKVTGNWRIIFRFENGHAFDVDYVDYHLERHIMTMKNPPHPGRIIKEDCLAELKLTAGAAAKTLGISRQTLDKIMNGRGGITPDMAIRFEKVFGSSAETWMRMQLAYDLLQARLREPEIVATIRSVGPALKNRPALERNPI